jgi:hypothetical protein
VPEVSKAGVLYGRSHRGIGPILADVIDYPPEVRISGGREDLLEGFGVDLVVVVVGE